MFKKSIGLCLAVFLVCVGIGVWVKEKSLTRAVSEKCIAQVDVSSLIDESFTVSPDSRRVAYMAGVGDKQFVVVDGKEEKQYDGIGTAPIFSPDSRRVAYVAWVSDKYFVVVDGKEGRQYDGMVRGGKIIFDSSDSFHYLALKGTSIYFQYFATFELD